MARTSVEVIMQVDEWSKVEFAIQAMGGYVTLIPHVVSESRSGRLQQVFRNIRVSEA